MGPGERLPAQCTDGQPVPLIPVTDLIPALRVPWKCHVLSLSGALCGGDGSVPIVDA